MRTPSVPAEARAGSGATATVEATVIVCVWNVGSSQVEACLFGLGSQQPAGTAGRFEVVVVDNNCGQPLRGVVAGSVKRGEPSVRLVEERLQGLSHARNAGITAARGDLLLFLDDDAIPAAGWVSAYLGFFRDHPEALCAGGPTVFDEAYFRDLPDSHRPLLRAIGGNNVAYETVRPMRPMRHPGGGNLAFRRSVFERYGRFDPNFGRRAGGLVSEEDTDLVRRFSADGHRCFFVPGALILHRPQWALWSAERLLERARRAGESQGRLLWEHAGRLSHARLFSVAALRYGSAWLRRALTSDPAVRMIQSYRLTELGGMLSAGRSSG